MQACEHDRGLMNSEIIAIGSELLTPFRQDTNSLFVTERLNQLGVMVAFKTIVGDRLEASCGCDTECAESHGYRGHHGRPRSDRGRSDARGCGGGDADRHVKRDPELIAQLYARAAARRMTMTRNNEKQADVLDGAIILANPRARRRGSGWTVVYGKHRKLVMLLPGPPSELKADVRRGVHAAAERGAAAEAHRDARAEGGADRRIGGGRADCAYLHAVHRCGDDDSGPSGRYSAEPECAARPLPELAQARVDELASRSKRNSTT